MTTLASAAFLVCALGCVVLTWLCDRVSSGSPLPSSTDLEATDLEATDLEATDLELGAPRVIDGNQTAYSLRCQVLYTKKADFGCRQ